jgi:dihydrofolate synthase / folylpolyglutamate synthase
MPSATDYVESLSPWPQDGFGLERIERVLRTLRDPQLAYPAVHVVGTNGKSTTTRMIEALLRDAGLRVGSYLSPHVSSWAERIRVDGEEADFERAIERVREVCEREGGTQFEVLTAAALAEFAAAGVDVAVVEAGLGGRHDATNVLDSRVVVLTSVALDHTDVLGSTREEIAAEKLAVAGPGSTVILPDDEFAHLVSGRVRLGGAEEAVEAFLGERRPLAKASLPGRLEIRDREIRDGAHTPEAVDWLLARLPEPKDYVVVASILGDKDAAGILDRLARAGRTLVATASTNPRALAAEAVAELARPRFVAVHTVQEPQAALALAHELGEQVLVTGSLYLLADLADQERKSVR